MKHLLITAFVLLGMQAYAQHTLTGSITDHKTQEKLVGVNISIPQTGQGSITDFEGNFKIQNIQSDDIEIVVSFIGYKEIHQKIHFDKKEKNIKIEMKESPFELSEVIVSTGLGKLQADNVMKVSHQSAKSMKRNGIQNLMDGIKQVPGVSALSTGTGISKPVIRGLTGNRVLVYNQGVRLENYQFGEEHGMGIDQAGVAGVEVIKGPASLLYGSDALGGVVYLIPEKFAPENETHLQISNTLYSNTMGIHSTVGVKTSGNKWQFLARGAYRLNGDYQIPNQLSVVNSTNHSQDVKLGLGYHNDKSQSELRYNYNHSINGMAHHFDKAPMQYQPVGKYQDLYNHNLSLKNTYHLSHSRIKTNAGFSSFTRQLINAGETHIGMKLNTLNIDSKWYAPSINKLDMIFGTQLMWQTNHNFGEHFLLPNATTQNAGIFANFNYKLDRLIIQGGLRYDYRHIATQKISERRKAIHKSLGSFTGAFGIKASITDKMNLRLNIASGFRAPNLAELTSNGEHENKIEIGDPDLKNEQNLQTDINWDYSSTHFEFFANAFYNHINHYIYLQEQTQFAQMLPVYKYVQNNAFLYGGEAGLHFHPHPWDWLHIKSSFETVIGKKQDQSYLPLMPADQWKNEIRISNKLKKSKIKYVYSFVQLNHTFDSRQNPDEDTYPAYNLINAGLGATFKYKKIHAVLNLSVHNLADKKYISNLSVLRENGIPNQGRNIILGVDVRY